jgi:hypothetical protein
MNQVIVRYKVKPERSPLSEVAAFEQFQHEINDRCEEQPRVSEVRELGSYRILDRS